MACLPDTAHEFLGPVQEIERGEIVGTAAIVLPALAGPEQDAGRVTGRRLACLHIDSLCMKGVFAGYSHSSGVRADGVSAVLHLSLLVFERSDFTLVKRPRHEVGSAVFTTPGRPFRFRQPGRLGGPLLGAVCCLRGDLPRF